MARRGALSTEDSEFLKANAGALSVEELAERLDRTPELIQKYVAKILASPADKAKFTEKASIREEFRGSQAWQRLKQEFTAEELMYFEEQYVQISQQFKGDILPTEQTQIFTKIKFELLMSRNLMARNKALEDIVRLEEQQRDFLDGFGGDPSAMSDQDKAFSLQLDASIRQAKSDESSRTTEYVKLEERHATLEKNLKVTRDQRFDKYEKAGIDFIGVIKMLQQRDVQEVEGRQMELMKLAGEKELVRLGRPHVYDDKSEDSPILCADTVHLGPEEAVDEPAEA